MEKIVDPSGLAQRRLPDIYATAEDQLDGDFLYTFWDNCGNQIGRAAISILPEKLPLYLRDIEIEERYQGLGFGAAAVMFLANEFGSPIVPVRELSTAIEFWRKLRLLNSENCTVQGDIELTDFRILQGSLVPLAEMPTHVQAMPLQWNAIPAIGAHTGIVKAISDKEIVMHVGQGKHVCWPIDAVVGDLYSGQVASIDEHGVVLESKIRDGLDR